MIVALDFSNHSEQRSPLVCEFEWYQEARNAETEGFANAK
jgi:hypothetical protein